MRKLIQTIKNIWKIEDLRSRILITLAFIAIYRLGAHISLPGINLDVLNDMLARSAQDDSAKRGIEDLLNMFTGGAFANVSIMMLGIMPYISASIVIQLLGMAIPYFQKLQKEGESGRKKITQLTRYLTIAICFFQSIPTLQMKVLSQGLVSQDVLNETLFGFIPLWMTTSMIILITGTMFVMWLGEKITDGGIGNGISLLIMIGIIASLPSALFGEFIQALDATSGGLVVLLVEVVLLVIIIGLSILLVQGTRRIPVQYAKRIVGNKQYGGVRQFIPLKVNAAGVMPIIFAQAIVMVPTMFLNMSEETSWLAVEFSNIKGLTYNIFYFVLIVVFTYFYTAITVNPKQMAEDMKKNGGFIPGIKPGRKTAEYLDNIMSRITLPGSLFLGFVAILPAIAMNLNGNMSIQFALFFGGTSLLIMVGVVLDTLQQIESHLLMRHYDGLMEKGKIKGKSSGNMM
ncbi:MAG: preprotein translocase subunit SecY [Flavobacteriales bacterium]|nr:preprotein translocase subunit SecY [Flavobacteriales bacterium]